MSQVGGARFVVGGRRQAGVYLSKWRAHGRVAGFDSPWKLLVVGLVANDFECPINLFEQNNASKVVG